VLACVTCNQTTRSDAAINVSYTNGSSSEKAVIDQAIADWIEHIDEPTLDFALTVTFASSAPDPSDIEVLAYTADFQQGPDLLPESATIVIWGDSPDSPLWYGGLSGPARVPSGKFDALTVARHELCHALGFAPEFTHYSSSIVGNVFDANGVQATLTGPRLDHVDVNFYPDDLMNGMLLPGVRLPISDLDSSMLQAAFGYDTRFAGITFFDYTFSGSASGSGFAFVTPQGQIFGHGYTNQGLPLLQTGGLDLITGVINIGASTTGGFPIAEFSGVLGPTGGVGLWDGDGISGHWIALAAVETPVAFDVSITGQSNSVGFLYLNDSTLVGDLYSAIHGKIALDGSIDPGGEVQLTATYVGGTWGVFDGVLSNGAITGSWSSIVGSGDWNATAVFVPEPSTWIVALAALAAAVPILARRVARPTSALALIVGWFFLPARCDATVYDLSADWSTTNNPNGPWSYNQGLAPLPVFTSNWHGTGLNAWGRTDNQPPAWGLLTIPMGNGGPGDVVVHSTNFEGVPTNVTWTSSASGIIDISGQAWDVGHDGTRDDQWSLLLNSVVLASRSSIDGVAKDSLQADFANNLVIGQSLSALAVQPGDVVTFQIQVNHADFGHFSGVELAIELVPEPSVSILLAGGCATLFWFACRKRHVNHRRCR
jgi:hypothetical protein